MTTPPWGHKPPAVHNVETFWDRPPPEPSSRLMYWAERYQHGWWHPNRWLLRQDYHSAAVWFGVYIWESRHVLFPTIWLDRGGHAADYCQHCLPVRNARLLATLGLVYPRCALQVIAGWETSLEETSVNHKTPRRQS